MTHKLETPSLITSARLRRRLRDKPQEQRDFSKGHGTFVLTSGLVVRIGANERSILLRHPSCRLWVHFHRKGLPEQVRYGAHIWVIGYLRTYNVGETMALTSAYCLSVSPQALMAAALREYPEAVIDHWKGEHHGKSAS